MTDKHEKTLEEKSLETLTSTIHSLQASLSEMEAAFNGQQAQIDEMRTVAAQALSIIEELDSEEDDD